MDDALVTAEWLARHVGEPGLVVLDCTVNVVQDASGGLRAESGRADFEQGHIPTAGFADLLTELSDRSSPVEFALPAPERLAAALGALGVGDGSRVVLYDSGQTGWAARVWWMLRWLGFDRAAILDGGLVAWELDGQPLSTAPADHPPRRLAPNVRPKLVADRDEVLAAVGDERVRLVDTLPAEHYRGDWALYARPGHIPTAMNLPSSELFDEQGRFRPDEELVELLGGDTEARHITYCGGGVAASANAFAMTRLGFRDVAVYTASLDEWAADAANPMVTGLD